MNDNKFIGEGRHKSWVAGRVLRPGLRFYILVYLGVMMLTAVILTSAVLFKITVTTLTQLEVRRAQDSLQSLRMSLGLLLEQERLDAQFQAFMQAMIGELSRELSLKRIVVVDADGKMLAYSSVPGFRYRGPDPDLIRAMGSRDPVVTLEREGTGFFSSGIRELSVALPVTRGRQVLGGIKATFSVAELDYNIKITQQVLLTFVVASTVLIMAFGIYYLSRTVIWPIRKIVRATGQFADGNLEARVDLDEQNELGYLARSFNNMVARIKKRELELKENVHALEEVNRDLKRTRTELIHSEKLASVGQLAQGVAHEIGNPLGAVLGYLEILLKSTRLGEEDKDLINRSEKEIARINGIILELLHYSRPTEAGIEQVNVAEVIKALITLISGQRRFNGIEIKLEIEKDLPLVSAEHNRLLQVLVNLAFNAADAMPQGGKLTIGAAQRAYVEPAIGGEDFNEAGDLARPLPEGAPVVQLWVKDTGNGMILKILQRVYDPFFTTKAPGEGTGLGLAISSRILEQFGSRLRIESRPGEGTTCIITFILGSGIKLLS